jgi:signal transduction histidine kinase
MDPSARWTQQLAEFVASVSPCTSEAAAARTAVERAAEVLDADVAALMAGGELLAAVGYAEGTEPLDQLKRMRPGAPDSRLEVPGVGWCPVAVAGLSYPADATLILARRDGLTREEMALLGGMARVTAMTMTMLRLLDHERAAREEVERLAREQAALRRVATLVAKAVSPEEIFCAVAEELGQLSGADIALVLRCEPDDTARVVGRWNRSEMPDGIEIGAQFKVEGTCVAISVLRTGRPARATRFAGPPGSVAECLRQAGVRVSNGSPIAVNGRLWGVVIMAATRPDGLRPETERRMPAFTELVATAIANAQTRVELRAIAEEQAAQRRVATLVARGALPDEVFAAVAREAGNALPEADFAMVARYDPGPRVEVVSVEVVGGWSRAGSPLLVGRRSPLGGHNVSTLVFERNGPARVDDHLIEGAEPLTTAVREVGMRSSAGAPISVDGRLWGVMIVASTREHSLLPGTEHQLAEFTELIATTIANTQARQEVSALADGQTALRRVATLVARGEPPRRVFAAVAQEVGRLLPADLTLIGRYEEGMVTGVAGWSVNGEPVPTRDRVSLGGRNVTEMVHNTGRTARLDSYADASGAAADDARGRGISSSVGAPISVEGRLWGIMVASAIHGQQLPPSTEARLSDFTELVATAIANAEAREELRHVAAEQAALRRVATLVAQGAPSGAVFDAVAEEVGRLLPADVTVLCRYDVDGYVTRIGGWSRTPAPIPRGGRSRLGGRDVGSLVFETGRSARIDDFDDDADPGTFAWRAAGLHSAVGAPISVEGRLWGLVVVMSISDEPLPADTEARLTGFTELVATAIAKAEANAELKASRARIVATADQTRRRIERDLHDGAQQRLVTLALQIRAAQTRVPAQLHQLTAELDHVAAGLSSTIDELREFARGIHPAILGRGGLAPALRALTRRSSIPVTLDMRARERMPEHVEVTAYYVISEALTNAAKHAKASAVHVRVDTADGVLRLDVRDDGVGGADPARGSGLIGLRDRVEASGGTFSVKSRHGEGTRLLVELPVLPLQSGSG